MMEQARAAAGLRPRPAASGSGSGPAHAPMMSLILSAPATPLLKR